MTIGNRPFRQTLCWDSAAQDMIGQIQKILWYDFANERWDPDKVQDTETLRGYISGVLSDYRTPTRV